MENQDECIDNSIIESVTDVCTDVSKTKMVSLTRESQEKCLQYRVFERWIALGFIALGVAVVCFLGLPWVAGLIFMVLNKMTFQENITFEQCFGTGDILPNFLGGFIGIVIGFVVEYSLINAMRTLYKYTTLLKLLELTFGDITALISNYFTNKESVVANATNKNSRCNIVYALGCSLQRIQPELFNDIINTAEYNTILLSLPLSKKNTRSLIYKYLHQINAVIQKNSQYIKAFLAEMTSEKLIEVEQSYVEINNAIYKFCCLSNINIDIKESKLS
ncbi:MAG: hypothetical protein K2M17_05175 [Bacilli bacterium]|nr:hypothetical protein [Bacilli bacterium]